MKKCYKCKLYKEYQLFYRRKTSNDGYTNKCKECTNKDIELWKANNPEKYKARRRKQYGNLRASYAAKFQKWYSHDENKLK